MSKLFRVIFPFEALYVIITVVLNQYCLLVLWCVSWG